MLKEDLFRRLDRLDEDVSYLYDENIRFRLVIVGGSALVLQNYLSRSTLDIDALEVSREIYTLLDKYDINCRVNAYIFNFPYNFEDRLLKLSIGGRRIDIYTASLEDIVISKLYSIRLKDIQDIENESILNNLDWNLLDKLASDENETKCSALNTRTYSEFKQSYDEYRRRFCK